ncbi:DinB family protein [Andreprevotia chitinilytica]|uniref:DinB family protein n=1 Tax=Andreprevotia chitinilytica TaxID=396808 RepID=UPI000558A449|nr:DinB family protein [Andreprevotia chitinilytica]
MPAANPRSDQFVLLGQYNQWMNAKVIEAAAQLPADELLRDRKAYFGSILGTLNHLIVADTMWLKRFLNHPAGYASLEPVRDLPIPASLDELVCPDLASYTARRQLLDGVISAFVAELKDADLDHVLAYKNAKGEHKQKRSALVLMHLFNHQTHHRGQASTLFFQAGVDVGVTDLPMLIPDEPLN